MKKINHLAAAAAITALTGCASTGGFSPQTQSAIKTTANGLIEAAQIYQAIGEPGLSPAQQSAFNSFFSAAGVIVQSYVGQELPPTSIHTGSAAVDNAIKLNLVPGANVTQSDADTVFRAAAPVAANH